MATQGAPLSTPAITEAGLLQVMASLYANFLSAQQGSSASVVATDLLYQFQDVFTENFLKIVTDEFELKNLVLKPTQRKLLTAIADMEASGLPVRVAVLKARQMGISTLIASWIFARVIFQHNSRAVIIADVKPKAQNLFKMYHLFWEKLPEALRPPQGVGTRHAQTMTFDRINASIEVMASNDTKNEETGSAGRSYTLRDVHFSEYPYFSNPEATFDSIYPAVPYKPGTAVFIESTPKGYGDSFQKIWDDPKSEFVKVFLGWYEDPTYRLTFPSMHYRSAEELERDLRQEENGTYGNEHLLRELYNLDIQQLHWRRVRIDGFKGSKLDTFRKEYPSSPEEAFRAASTNFLNTNIMVFLKNKAKEPLYACNLEYQTLEAAKEAYELAKRPDTSGMVNERVVQRAGEPLLRLRGGANQKFVRQIPHPNGFLTVWEEPLAFTEYILGGDTSEGAPSKDFNVGYVAKRVPFRKPEVVARLRGDDYHPLGLFEYADLMLLAGYWYNTAALCFENNFEGWLLKYVMEEAAYPNLVYERDIKMGATRMAYDGCPRAGWRSTYKSRKYVQTEIQKYFEEHYEDLVCPDAYLIEEAMRMQREPSGAARAPRKGMERRIGESALDYCDDCVFALGAVLLADESLPPCKTDAELRFSALDKARERLYGDRMQPEMPFLARQPHFDGSSQNYAAMGV